MINPDREMKANFMMIAEIFEPEPKCSIYKLGLQTSISSSRNVNHYITNPLKQKGVCESPRIFQQRRSRGGLT